MRAPTPRVPCLDFVKWAPPPKTMRRIAKTFSGTVALTGSIVACARNGSSYDASEVSGTIHLYLVGKRDSETIIRIPGRVLPPELHRAFFVGRTLDRHRACSGSTDQLDRFFFLQ